LSPAPVRTVTRGPAHHGFGYYDKHEFDPSDRDRWIPLGESRAWGWQQGCMLQWRPGSDREVVWNDRADGRFVCRIRDVRSGAERRLEWPIYTLSPDGRFALTTDFARIQRMRPGYGYTAVEPHRDERAPADSGVWRLDLETGACELVLSLADVARIPHHGQPLDGGDGKDGCWHYFNHLLVSPDSRRFVVLHRWRRHLRHPRPLRALLGFQTRMFTVGVDGSEPHVLDATGHASHFVWRDPEHVLAWTRPPGGSAGFHLFKDRSSLCEPVGGGVMTRDGHASYLPGCSGEWILNDTYPDWLRSRQSLYLFHVPGGRRVELGSLQAPRRYFGEWRCDLHPRASRSGRLAATDSPHAGGGRQLHLVDLGPALGEALA
jgi:hypothetical protein